MPLENKIHIFASPCNILYIHTQLICSCRVQYENKASLVLSSNLISKINRGYYTVARRYEFYFRVAKQYFTNERSEWVKYCFCHEKIKFISSSRRVMFFLLYRQKDIDKIIDFYSPKSNCDGSNLQYSDIRHCLQ